MKKKTRSPAKVRSLSQVCQLGRDNFSTKNGWILVDGGSHVTIANQRPGQAAESMTCLPRAEFDKMVRWYLRPQVIR